MLTEQLTIIDSTGAVGFGVTPAIQQVAPLSAVAATMASGFFTCRGMVDDPDFAEVLCAQCNLIKFRVVVNCVRMQPIGFAAIIVVIVITSARVSDGTQLASCGADGTVRLWDLEGGQEVQRFEGHGGGVLAVAALPERGQALSAGSAGTVRLWDLEGGQELQRFEGHGGGVLAVSALPERGSGCDASE